MIREVYAALIEAGASEEKASSAAEAISNYDNELSGIKAELKLIKWMLTFNMGLVGTILFLILKYLIK
ncbi:MULTISPECIES: hypothetical protein [Phaeodactylibacter]|nr:hypothetical protein [Phaeodactylibacter luteus]